MPGMRGLTLIVATADAARLRAALTLACTHAALGGGARVFLHEEAVGLLGPAADVDADARRAAGLPDRHQLLAMAADSGVSVTACQTGLALAGLAPTDLPDGVDIGGMVGVVATLGEDRVIFA
ncbi:MAG: peroxiredoxin [Pseudomonadota bacterium]